MDKLLTISVAAYNVESYLGKLLDSVTCINPELLDRIEVLIINDGSKDKTAEISERYEHIFPSSVRLVSKENEGYGSTFNRGFREAKGKYFRSLDGDDWVDSKNLEDLVSRLDRIDSDLILSDMTWVYTDGREELENFPALEADRVYTFDETVQKVTWMRIHTLIYKTSILRENHIELDPRCFYVDLEYDLYPLPYIDSVYYFGKPLYCYRIGNSGQSISSEGRKKNINHGLTVAKSLLDYFQSQEKDLSESKRRYCIHAIADYCVWISYSLLLFDASRTRLIEIREFDEYIRERSEEIYYEMEHLDGLSRKMVQLRNSNYAAYWIIKAKETIKRILGRPSE